MSAADPNEQLEALERAERAAAGLADQGRRATLPYTIGVGLLTAGLLLVSLYAIEHARGLWVASMAFYGVAVGVLTVLYNRRRRASGRGAGSRYKVGLFLTMGLYVATLLVANLTGTRESLGWIAAAVLVVLPVAIIPNLPGRAR